MIAIEISLEKIYVQSNDAFVENGLRVILKCQISVCNTR
jgi:hypothetical protein